MANYVRFLKGTPTAFAKLENKDNNTLYFISEKDAQTGKLYLGNKLIAGSDGVPSTLPTKLEDLTDVVADVASEGSILVYNDQGKWVPRNPAEVAASIVSVMTGANETSDGTSGLVPTPKQGDQNLFLRGDATWANPVSEVESQLSKLIGEDSNKTIRTIVVEELTKQLIAENAAESLNELQEIANWIQQHPKDAATMNSDITNLNSKVTEMSSTVSNLDAIINGKEGKDGEDGIVSLVTRVGDLENSIIKNTTNITNLIDNLQWHNLNEDGTEEKV